MSIPLSNSDNIVLISQLKESDVIQYQSEHVKNGIYYIFSIEIDDKIPATLLQLWRFTGGYDHAFANVLEMDLGLNKRVQIFKPNKIKGKIEKIISYRPTTENLSDKEEFFFDIWPKSVSDQKDSKHVLPFECEVKYDNKQINLIITQWTPLQKVPVEKVKIGTEIEFWKIEDNLTLMKILQI